MAASSTPTIQYLRLDATYDPVFDPSATLTNGEAVAQAILTRLKLFYGEWWESLTDGLPVFQTMLGKPGFKSRQNAMQLAIDQRVRSTPYVTTETNVAVSFVDGVFKFNGTAQTAFGVVNVGVVPGASASLSVQ